MTGPPATSLEAPLTKAEEKRIQDLAKFFQFRHKVSFVCGILNVWISSGVLAATPSLYFVWHTAKGVPLLITRVVRFTERKWTFFLLDFCYWVNLLLFIFLWIAPQRDDLFRLCFFFSNGPLLFAIPTFHNSLVLHSVDHMTSMWLHMSPAITTFALRWASSYPVPPLLEGVGVYFARDFNTCATQECTAAALVAEIGYIGIIQHAVVPGAIVYALWVAVYCFVVFGVEKEKIEKEHYELLLDSPVVKMITKPLGGSAAAYFLVHAAFSCVLCLFTVWLWDHFFAHVLLLLLMGVISSWNGASFYFDYFAKKYLASIEKRAVNKVHPKDH